MKKPEEPGVNPGSSGQLEGKAQAATRPTGQTARFVLWSLLPAEDPKSNDIDQCRPGSHKA
jgi:hypothetical protein